MEHTKDKEQGMELPIKNLHDLLENVKMAGFGQYLDQQIQQELLAGKAQFSVNRTLQIDADRMDYRLDIRVDKGTEKGYFNDMQATLTEKTGMQRSQLFPRFLRITAKEAYNLLKWGLSSGVEKSLFNRVGVRYRSFISLDINSEKDLYGSYPLMQYHENYYKEPFTIQGALRKLPVSIKEEITDGEWLMSSLKRGNMTAVTVLVNGGEEKAYLSINVKVGRLELRDTDLKVMDLGQNVECVDSVVIEK